jgi:hypothetical protein
LQRRAISTLFASASGTVSEELRHLLGAAQILLRAVAARAAPVGEQVAFLYADARLVRVVVARAKEADVVGRDERDAAPRGERDRGARAGLFARPARALELEVEAIAEKLEPGVDGEAGASFAAGDELAPDVAVAQVRERDQSVRRVAQPRALEPRRTAATVPRSARA